MWFLTVIFANLRGRPARSLLTLSGIAVAVAAVVSLLGVVRGFERSLLELHQGRGVDVMVQQAGRLQMTSSVLRESIGETISAVNGVVAVHPSLIEVLSLIQDDLMGVVVQGWSPDSGPVQKLKLLDGALFSGPEAREVIVGQRLASALGVAVGGTVELLEGEPFRVVGVFESGNVFDSGSMFVPLRSLQRLMFREGEVTMFAVVAERRDPESLRDLAARIRLGVDGKVEAEPADDLARRSTEIRVARSFAWLTSVIAVTIGSIGMLNTMMMAVFERTREIAMLRALGWRRRRVIAMILGEATLLSVAGAAIGVLASILFVRFLASLPASGRLVSGDLPVAAMGQGVLLALLLGLIGGLYPAWSAARLTPVEGLRHD
ncbi:MAG: ABC transporter permease [Planctomycetaceae bacterium]|nr:MAG: ABC transporter permease [Planctomycetaceae bacterium]